MPQVPSAYYPAISIWDELVRVLETDDFIASEIINERTGLVEVHRLPLEAITVNTSTFPNSKAISVGFKTEVEPDPTGDENGLRIEYYYYYLSVISQNADLSIAIVNCYKLLEDCRYTIELEAQKTGLISLIEFLNMSPVPPQKPSLWAYMAGYQLKIRTDGIYSS